MTKNLRSRLVSCKLIKTFLNLTNFYSFKIVFKYRVGEKLLIQTPWKK